jgi:Transposase
LIKDEDIISVLKQIEDHIKDELKSRPEKKRDWRTYEQMDAERIRDAIKSLDPLIHEAVSAIHIYDSGPGRPSLLTLEQKVKLLLIKQLVGKSNREFAYMLEIFSMISGIDISYKTVERLYSDELVMMALHNLHVLLLKKKGIKESDATGDGTGYSLTVKKNYESYAQELKDKAKENRNDDKGKQSAKKRKTFAYSFRLMDLRTKMYIAFGSSMKSEKEAFDNAINFIKTVDVKLKSIRLDKYYSESSYVSLFDKDTAVYVIPKKDATLNGSQKWKDTMKEFITNTFHYLKEYYKRENSEAGFSADKRLFGWEIAQRREDRIDSALFCTGLWHNLFNLNG